MKRLPLWELLVNRGFFPDRETASRWVMTGAVLVNEQRVDKAGTLIKQDADIRIKGIEMPYVGRGGLKLAGALADFGVSAQGRVALDTGASTGGFTDCLLQHGASRVYAVDVGYGQLAGKLRIHPHVVNMERTNIGAIEPDTLQPPPSLATVDLSYLSLRTAIPIVVKLVSPDSDLLCLVKPLFEVDDMQARRTGQLQPELYAGLLQSLAGFVDEQGLYVGGITASPIKGNNGTEEFFLHVKTTPPAHSVDITADIEKAILALNYHKIEA